MPTNRPIQPQKTNLISFPHGQPISLGQNTTQVITGKTNSPPKQIVMNSSNIIHIKPGGKTQIPMKITTQNAAINKGTIRTGQSPTGAPPAKFAKVLIRDENGQDKTVLIPADKFNLKTRNPIPVKVRIRSHGLKRHLVIVI